LFPLNIDGYDHCPHQSEKHSAGQTVRAAESCVAQNAAAGCGSPYLAEKQSGFHFK
jgi:hypothetical protein